ncbi:MAG TPA: tetratricopeptide repeat protein [Ktedonobacterales bacterium]|jgi:tetratricopeptide (TPR) repeat protein
MANDPTVQAIWLAVSDLERSRAFYRDVVGLRPAAPLAGAAQFELGSYVRLWLWPSQAGPLAALSTPTQSAEAAPALPPNAGAPPKVAQRQAAPWGALVLAVPEGIEARCQELEARGVVFETPLTGSPLGRMARFPDPDGHLLCLWEPNPATTALARPPSDAATRQNQEMLTLLGRAEDAKTLGDYDEAVTLYQMIVAAEPAYSVAWGTMSYALNQQGRYAESLAASERALALDPTLAEVWNNRGNALHALGRHEDALAAFDRGIRLAPATPEFLINKALALASISRQAEALALLDRALVLNQFQAVAWSNRGWVLSLLGRYDEALESVEHALGLGLQAAGALDTKGYALAGLSRHAEALACYNRALLQAPHDAEILAHKAASLQALGRGPSADRDGEGVERKEDANKQQRDN